MFETVFWLSWMSLTIIHNNFQPHFQIFHVYELSITSLCLRAHSVPSPIRSLNVKNHSQVWSYLCPKCERWSCIECPMCLSSVLYRGASPQPLAYNNTHSTQGCRKYFTLWEPNIIGQTFAFLLLHEFFSTTGNFFCHRKLISSRGNHSIVFIYRWITRLISIESQPIKVVCYCSAWLRLKLNTKIGLHTTHPPQTF